MVENCSVSRITLPMSALTLILLVMPASHFGTGLFAESQHDKVEDDSLPEGAVLRLGTDRFRQEDEAKQVAYSQDGKMLASISRDSVIIWNAQTGQPLRRLRSSHQTEYAQEFATLSISPDSEELAATNGSRVHVWEIETGLELLDFPVTSGGGFRDDVRILHSPNGEQLAVMGGLSIGIYDTTSGKLIKELTIENHQASFCGLCWTSDGSRLCAATLDPAVVTWETQSGKVVRKFRVQNGQNFSHAPVLSQDEKMLFASTGGTINVWQFETGMHLKKIELDADFIHTIAVSPDHKTLIAGSQDANIHFIEIETGELKRKIESGLWIARSMAVSPDFKTVAIGAVYPTVRQWDIETGQLKYPELTARGHDAEVQCVAYSPDGRLIASGGPNHQINLWEASTGRLVRRIPSKSSANCLTFSPSGDQLLTCWSQPNLIRVWDVATGEQLQTIDPEMNRVREFAFAPDTKHLIVVATDSKSSWHSPIGEETFQVWDFKSGKKLRQFPFPTSSTESIGISRDGKSLITGSANGIIHVLDLQSGDELATLVGHRHSIDSLALNVDGTLLASGSTDQTVRLWDTKSWEIRHVLKGHNRSVTSVAFSPNGHMLASGSGKDGYPLSPENSQKIRVWNVRSGEQLGEFSGHDTNTAAVAFSPDGQRLVSAHDNTTLLVWDVSQLTEP